jgi:hypothetical protein
MEQKPCVYPDFDFAVLDNQWLIGGKNPIIHRNPKKAGMKLRLSCYYNFQAATFPFK